MTDANEQNAKNSDVSDAEKIAARFDPDDMRALVAIKKSAPPVLINRGSNARVGPHMSMDAKLSLHTKLASALWKGRRTSSAKKRDGIPGVLRFAAESGRAWNESSLNNHIADMYLILAEERYEKAKTKIETATRLLQELLDVQSVFDGIGIMTNNKPFTYELKFNCPWGYLASSLLKQYDDLIRLALTAKHVGFLGDQDWNKLVNEVGRAFRGFLQSFDAFIPIPIDRDWYINRMTGKTKKVIKHFGFANREVPNVPDDIMLGERRPKLAPPIKNEKERENIRERNGNFTNSDMTELVSNMPIRSAEAKQARKEQFKAEAKFKAEAEARFGKNKSSPVILTKGHNDHE